MRRAVPLSASPILALLLPAASFAATYVHAGPGYPASAITSTGTPAHTAATHVSAHPEAGCGNAAASCSSPYSVSAASGVNDSGGVRGEGTWVPAAATSATPTLSLFGLALLAALTIAAPALPQFGLALLAILSAAIGAARRRRKTRLIAPRR